MKQARYLAGVEQYLNLTIEVGSSVGNPVVIYSFWTIKLISYFIFSFNRLTPRKSLSLHKMSVRLSGDDHFLRITNYQNLG